MTTTETLLRALRNLMVSEIVFMTSPDPLESRNAKADADSRASAFVQTLEDYVDERVRHVVERR